MDSRGPFIRGLAINRTTLRQARLDLHLSLAQAARGIVSPQAWQQYEAGKIRPIPPVVDAIAERLGVSVETLLTIPHDPRERRMQELHDLEQWSDLERLANRVLADPDVTLRTMAIAHYYAGRSTLYQAPAYAADHFREAQRHLAKYGERSLAAEAIDWEAAALCLMEDPRAVDVGRRALVRYRMLRDRDPRVESRMLEHVATYLLQRREYKEAIALYRQALEVANKVLDLARMANIFHGLAEGHLQAGQTQLAMDYMERAISFYRTDHEVRGPISGRLARAENDYGCHLMRNGRDLARAEEMIRASIAHYGEIGVESGRSAAMRSMGELLQLQNNLGEAINWTSQAIEIAEQLGETVSTARGYEQLGELWAASGEVDRFEACFSRALEVLDSPELVERRAEALARYRRARDAQLQRVTSGQTG